MKVAGVTNPGPALVLTREHLAAGRCLRAECQQNHLDDLQVGDVAVLACYECGRPAIVAWDPASSRLKVGCIVCALNLATIEVPTFAEALERINRRAANAGAPS